MKRKYELLSSVQLVSQIPWTLPYVYYLTNFDDDDTSNFHLADVNYMLGFARRSMNLLFLSINVCWLIALIFTKFSTVLQPKRCQYWPRACEVFETTYFRRIGNFDFELMSLYPLEYVFIALDLKTDYSCGYIVFGYNNGRISHIWNILSILSCLWCFHNIILSGQSTSHLPIPCVLTCTILFSSDRVHDQQSRFNRY